MAPSDGDRMALLTFCFHALFSGVRVLFGRKMNSDGIVFGGKRMRENKALFLELILRIAN
jgi:hypothetical protein